VLSKENEVIADSDYEVIGQAQEVEHKEQKEEEKNQEKSMQEESKDILDKIAVELTKAYVMPDLLQIKGDLPHESLIQRTVRDTLNEYMPSILFSVRAKLTKQALIKLPNSAPINNMQEQNQEGQASQRNQLSSLEEKGAVIFDKMWKAIGELPDAAVKITDKVASKLANVMDMNAKEGSQEQQPQPAAEVKSEDKEDSKPEFIDSVAKTLLKLPNTATSMADNFIHKLNGDPYILTAEGRYPKSVLEKANQLKTIFPEEDKKEMLEYIQKLPKEIQIEQAASLYADYKNI
jgi:hypothetical protein